MGRNIRGKRDGTGPYKKSYQGTKKKIGRRREKGVKCPRR